MNKSGEKRMIRSSLLTKSELEDTIYIARGYIELPEQVRDDTSAPVEVCFPGLGGNYSIR